MVREECQHWVALGAIRVWQAAAIGQRVLLAAAMGGLDLLPAFVRGKRLILQHATAHVDMTAEAHQQTAGAIQVRAIWHVLPMEARGRAHVTAASVALHGILSKCIAQCKALVSEDALHRRMDGAAARRGLCMVIV